MNWWNIIRETTREFFFNDDPWTHSASIAFYVIFSLPAIVIITMSVAGSLHDDVVVRENLLEQARMLLGPDSAATIQGILNNAGAYGDSLIIQIIGIGILIFSATTVIATLQHGINNIWGVRPHPEKNFFKFVVSRLLSLGMVISMGFLLLVSLLVDAFLTIFRDLVVAWLSGASFYVISAGNFAISLVVIALIFAVIFKVLPDAKVAWRDAWAGGLATSLLFTLGKFLIGFYLGNSAFSTVYGAAGSLVVMLIWIYYSAAIVLVGAEFTYVYSKARGRGIQPDRHAERFRKGEEQGRPG